MGLPSEWKVSSRGEFQCVNFLARLPNIKYCHPFCGVSQPSTVLTFVGGVEMGVVSDGFGDWEL